MSVLKVNSIQIGQSGTATNNFVWYQPTSPDGTIRLANGNAGSATDILTINSAGNATFVGSVIAAGTATSAADLKLYEDTDNGTNYVALKAPAAVASNITFVLPSTDGSAGQALKTDGSGNLSFGAVDALPTQTGNSGKYLTTDGATASWATITKTTVGLANVENTALSTWAGSSNVTTLGTIDTGTWNATNIGLNKGGTNAALTAANGGVVYSTSSAMAITAAGTAGQVLTSNGAAAPTWTTISAGITITNDTSTNSSYYPAFINATSGTVSAARVSSTKLYFNPSTGVLYSTTFQSSSDVTKKTNVVTAASDVVDQLRGVEFDWIDGSGSSAGVIAQEIEAVVPRLVSTNEDGTKNVNYDGIIAYLIENIKQLNAKVRELESK